MPLKKNKLLNFKMYFNFKVAKMWSKFVFVDINFFHDRLLAPISL